MVLISDMGTFRDRVNEHLPVVLQFLSTASLVVIALSAMCGSQSLKKLSEANEMRGPWHIHRGHTMKYHKMKMHLQNWITSYY